MDELSDMTLDQFNLWSIHALKVYLAKRKQSINGTFEELAARAFCAWEKGVPVDHDGEEIEMRLLKEYKAKLLVDGDVIPDPVSLSSGWTGEKKGIQQWPSIYITDISMYIEGCGHSAVMNKLMSEYKLGKAYRYFDSGWVREVFIHEIRRNSDKCVLKAKVTPSQGTNNACYNVWICVRKDLPDKPGGEILSAYCTCTAGMYGTCNHIAGVLFRCEHAVKTGETSTTCTSKPSAWNVPKGKPVFKPLKATDATWKKGHFTKTKMDKSEEHQRKTLKRNFTPYHKRQKTDLEDTAKLRQSLFSIATEEVKDSCFCLAYEGRRLKKESLEMPPTVLENAKTSSSKEDFLNKMNLTRKQIENVKEETVNQSDTPAWFEQRNGRITASNFKRVCTRVDTLKQNETTDAAKLVNSILGKDKPVKTKAMKHGIALEAFAKKEYKKMMKKTHKKFSSINTGLQISADKPFLAASVDLETSCKCCGEGLCEIKCPETIKDQKPTHENVKYIKENDGIVSLCENHQYFFQIQGQMAVSKRDHCDFFVFTYHGSLCIRVPFSAEFWATMEEKLTWFWMEHVLCSLMDEIDGKENACIGEANVKQKAEQFTPLSKKDVSSNGNRTLEKKSEINNNCVSVSSDKPVRRTLLLDVSTKKTLKIVNTKQRRKKAAKTPIYLCGTCGDECVDIPEHSKDQSVGCDKCGVWVHYRCAGVTDESVQDIDRWICARCEV